MYQLTRHLEVAFDEGSSTLDVGRGARYLLMNALLGTRLLCQDDAWDILKAYRTPLPLGTSDIEQRAAQANILSLVDSEITSTDLSDRFETIARKLLHYRKVEPAEDIVGIALQIKERCQPTQEYDGVTHYLWQDPKKLFNIVMDHMVAFLRLELKSSQVFPMSCEFAKQSLGRPERNGDFAQQLCTLHTSLDRARRIKERFPAPAKFLTLGDDDLMSLALADEPGYEIDVFEIDRSLVRFIKKRKSEAVRVFSRDLTHGLPEEFHGLYDAVLADPPYNIDGMSWFIQCCSQGLKPTKSSRLYLSTYPDLLEDAQTFFAEFGKNGLVLEQTTEFFNRYPFPEETHQITSVGLKGLGFHPELIKTIMSVPYLYAHLYECKRL